MKIKDYEEVLSTLNSAGWGHIMSDFEDLREAILSHRGGTSEELIRRDEALQRLDILINMGDYYRRVYEDIKEGNNE